MTTYISKAGEMVDEIVWRHYGTDSNGIVEAVLNANPGLADYGMELPLGVTVTLPDMPSPQPKERLQLFS